MNTNKSNAQPKRTVKDNRIPESKHYDISYFKQLFDVVAQLHESKPRERITFSVVYRVDDYQDGRISILEWNYFLQWLIDSFFNVTVTYDYTHMGDNKFETGNWLTGKKSTYYTDVFIHAYVEVSGPKRGSAIRKEGKF